MMDRETKARQDPLSALADFNVRLVWVNDLDGQVPDRSIDVITLWDVIEHTPDPSRVIRRVSELVKPGGLLIVNYPDIGSSIARLLGRGVNIVTSAAFLEDRLGLDFTWYHKRTDNLLQSISVAPSSGFISTQLTNLGEISNRGIELLVTAYPVQRGGTVWESRLNLATNRNRLERLKGDRQGQHSIRINDQWRICFVWRDGEAYDVEIVDYH